MTIFNPPELQQRVVDACRLFGEFMDIEWECLDQNYALSPSCSMTVTEQSVIEDVCLPRTEFGQSLTVAQLLEWAEGVKRGNLIDRREYTSPSLTLVYVEPLSDLAHAAVGELVERFGDLAQTSIIGGKEYRVRLMQGMTLFGVKIAQEGSYEKWCPPCQQHDTFVEVSHPGGDYQTASALVDAYLYELTSSLGLQFGRARYFEAIEDWDEYTKSKLKALGNGERLRIRHLLHGAGVRDLIVLFNEATNVGQVEYGVLGYTKAIEYVSATVVKQHSHQAIRTRLLAPAALRPDAAYIEGLLTLVEDQRAFQKDSEAIRLTIETCCDAPSLVGTAPKHLTALTKITEKSKADEKKETLRKLAECVAATRNQIVHAKTNFTPKGHECPEDQLDNLRACLKVAAEQVIRWFADVSESFRVLKGS